MRPHWQVLSKLSNIAADKSNDSGYPVRMQPILAHLKLLTDKALKRGDRQAASLANSLGSYQNLIADYESARPYIEQALAIRKKVLGEEHP